MTSSGIRTAFLTYFEGKGHAIIPSSPLVPRSDPTLLFTNAGMVQFKRVFLGEETRPTPRAATVQKCLRAGGKHNDLENVGYTARHHTFFEMLGNFSFADYFKEDAVTFAWDLLTKTFSLPPKDLWITIYKDDDEAFALWKKIAKVKPARIVRRGEEDNFWAMGDVGPCGPCSEVIIDQGPGVGCGRPQCDINCSCDRFLELWNLVFMQYSRDERGALSPLPKPSIDTGMGLERIAAVLQGVKSNYETDLFVPIIREIEKLSQEQNKEQSLSGVSPRTHSLWAIADHARAMTFLIADGVLPSNEGQGYVLRRIMRRAGGHGKKLGIRGPFLHTISHTVIRIMGDAYPEIVNQGSFVSETIRAEEERFMATLERGMELFSQEIASLKRSGHNTLPGGVAFRLYDTYGFPMDMTRDLVREEGLLLDEEGFQREMEAQRKRAQEARPQTRTGTYKADAYIVKPTQFIGYHTLTGISEIIEIRKKEEPTEKLLENDRTEIIVKESPFYGESGGQVGDKGRIEGDGGTFIVKDCVKTPEGVTHHIGSVEKGSLSVGDMVHLQVDPELRVATAANHTATHLLHWALRRTLGENTRQAGSLVTPERFRFDFASQRAPTKDQIIVIEDEVNARIRENHPVRTDEMPYKDALKTGATALFGEKYGDMVRIVRVGDFSTELCGGTHVRATGEIGLLIITSEGAIGSGMRRIEALTGMGALVHLRNVMTHLEEASELVGAGTEDLAERVKKLLEEKKALKKEIEGLTHRMVNQRPVDYLSQVREFNGVKVLSTEVEGVDVKALRDLADSLKERLGKSVVVLGTTRDGKAHLVACVSKDLTSRFHAGKLVKAAAEILGGSGGGREDFAQAGGGRTDRLKEALERIYTLVESE